MTKRKKKLEFEALPTFAHGKNLRHISQHYWRQVRAGLLEERGCQCEICGTTPESEAETRNFHAHEDWEFDLENHILILKHIGIICDKCHQVGHMGLLEVKIKEGILPTSYREEIIRHYAKVNKKPYDRAEYDYLKFNFKWIRAHQQQDPTLSNAHWTYRLDCEFPCKDKMTQALIKKGLLAEDAKDDH